LTRDILLSIFALLPFFFFVAGSLVAQPGLCVEPLCVEPLCVEPLYANSPSHLLLLANNNNNDNNKAALLSESGLVSQAK